MLTVPATECVYTPKQKPGLKPGAVEALTRRVGTRMQRDFQPYLTKTAFLEQILLDESGSVRQQYSLEAHDDSNNIRDVSRAIEAPPAATPRIHSRPDATAARSSEQQILSSATDRSKATVNPLKRKHDEPEAERWLFATEELDLAQYLPSQAVLLKVVDFFTTSFHHWIPYLHKQRLRNKVSEGICSNGLMLVLHALVAVALRHMEPNVLFMDVDQIQRQSGISRTIVETHAIRSVSIESLQALLFIVFDYVSSKTFVCIEPQSTALRKRLDHSTVLKRPIVLAEAGPSVLRRLIIPQKLTFFIAQQWSKSSRLATHRQSYEDYRVSATDFGTLRCIAI